MRASKVLVRLLMLLLGGALIAGSVAAPAPARDTPPAPRPGGQTSRDSLFPQQGNRGYDVASYRIAIGYDATTGGIEATTRIRAYARRALSSFSLDLEGLTVRSVTVDGRRATWTRAGAKLVITPARPIRRHFQVRIRYHGVPQRHIDPDESSEGWIATADGATALNEPVGAMTWFPVNNSIRDKATFTYRITAPATRAVAANGELVSRRRSGADTTWTWRLRVPIPPYLTMVSIGDYRVYRSRIRLLSGRRIPVWTFVQRSLGDFAAERALLPEVIRFQERRYGPYPFDSAGYVIHELDVGYALETATRPFFPGRAAVSTIVHEQAHQYYGNIVTPCDWGGIWLNEGFAVYAEWQWDAAHGGPSTAEAFAALYAEPATSSLWRPAPAALPGPADLFARPVYDRGAMALEALRQRVGTPAFNAILRRWAARPVQRCVTTEDLLTLAERISGIQLDQLFAEWLFRPGKPTGYEASVAARSAVRDRVASRR